MAMSTEQFGKSVVTAGLLTVDDLKALWSDATLKDRPKDGPSLAKVLIERGLLNEFQAEELLAGRKTPLILGQYVLLAKIGAGGMGQVYRAQHKRMKRVVAIKVLPAAMVQDEGAVKRFQREVEAAAKLSHTNIVQAFDADEYKGTHYLVMEYVDGHDLSAIVKKAGPLSVDVAIDYLLQAARGLAFAHSKGVVHRDIKPANLLVDQDGVVKILDMGLARVDNAGEANDHQLTNTGQVMGTVDYMAPEQASDTRRADARSDIYSLGCSLYRMLTGASMFGGDTVVQKILAHMNDPIPRLNQKRPEISGELERIYQKMVAKKPEDRYQQTSQLVADLEALRGGSSSIHSTSGAKNAELDSFMRSIKADQSSPGSSSPSNVLATKTDPSGSSPSHSSPSGSSPSGSSPSKGATMSHDDGMTAAFGHSPQKSLDMTMDEYHGEQTTDPNSQANAHRPGAGGRGKKPSTKLIAAGAAGFLLVLAGIIVIIKGPGGDTLVEIDAPAGSKVIVKPSPASTKPVASPPGKTPAASVKPATPSPAVTSATPASEMFKTTSVNPLGERVARWPFDPQDGREYTWSVPENLGPNVNGKGKNASPTLSGDQLCLIVEDTGSGSNLLEGRRKSVNDEWGKMTRFTTGDNENNPSLSGDGLTLIFAATNYPGINSLGKSDLYIRRRVSRDAPWQPVENLGNNINSPDDDHSASISPDGLAIVFSSNRPGGSGGKDLWIARRQRNDTLWGVPQNVGSEINTTGDEIMPKFLPDGRNLLFERGAMLYLTETVAGKMKLAKLPRQDYAFYAPWLSPDGQTVYFHNKDFPGGFGAEDIWLSRRVLKTASTPSDALVVGAPVDLLKLIDVNRDSVLQRWSMDGNVLVSKGNGWLRVPFKPDSNYQLTLQAQNTTNNSDSFRIGLQVADQLACATLDMSNKYLGLEDIDSKSLGSQEMSSKIERPIFNNQNSHTVVIRVQGPQVEILVDGDKVYSFAGGKKLGIPGSFPKDKLGPEPFFLGTNKTYRISKFEYAPLTPASTPSAESNVVYLDDLTELDSSVGYRTLMKHGQTIGDRLGPPESLRFKGQAVAHSLLMHPPKSGAAFATYQLDGQFDTFTAEAGLPDNLSQKPGSSVVFRVVGDGRELWKSGAIANRSQGEAISVSVRGVKQLRLETTAGVDNGNCHATWFNPRLMPIASTGSPNVVYLDDLQEVSYRDGLRALGKHGLEDSDKPFTFRGLIPKHALVTHPKDDLTAKVLYRLDGKYQSFDTQVGFTDDASKSGGLKGKHTFRVVGDGRELWKSPQFSKVDGEAVCSVSVAGVRELQLELICEGKSDRGYATWLNPRLTPLATGSSQIERLLSSDYGWSEPESLGPVVNAMKKTSIPSLTDDERCLIVRHYEKSGDPRNGTQEYRRPSVNAPWEPAFKVAEQGENYASLSADGLTVVSVIQGGKDAKKNNDLALRTRPSRDAPWGNPSPIASLNTESSEYRPVISPDGLSLVFGSNRAGGSGGNDLWISRRANVYADWQPPVNLGAKVNTSKEEAASQILADNKSILFNREGDLFLATPDAQGNYDVRPVLLPAKMKITKGWLSPDGMTLYFDKVDSNDEDNEIRLIRRRAKAFTTTSSSSPAPRPASTIPVEALTFNGHRYLLVDSPGNWTEAKAKAEALGGHLATITSKEERDWVLENIWKKRSITSGDTARIFLGGVQAKNGDDWTWTWVTKELFDASLWLGKGPNGGANPPHGISWTGNNEWDDVGNIGFKANYLLVEWDALGPAISTPTIPAEALTFAGHRYLLVNSPGTWDEAKAKAEALGGHLATITSKQERDWALENFFNKRPIQDYQDAVEARIFLGADQPADNMPWSWVTGEPFDRSVWLGTGADGDKTSTVSRLVLTWWKSDSWDDVGKNKRYRYVLVEWDTLGPAVASVTSPSPLAPSPSTDALDRKVAQRLLDLKFPVKLTVAGKVISIKPGSPLPTQPLAITGIDTGASASMPRAELTTLLSDFRQLSSVNNTFMPLQDCDLWAETFGSMPSIMAVNASRCEALTDIGAAHLARLPKLEYVNLGSSVKITSVGLAAFEKCQSLTTIELSPEAVAAGNYTLADIQKLQDALPKTRVVYGGVKPIPGLNKPAATPAPQPAPAKGESAKVIDLLPLVDGVRDTVAGEWTFTAKGLNVASQVIGDTGGKGIPRLQFPYTPPEEYDLLMEFTATAGSSYIGCLLNSQERNFQLLIDRKVAGANTWYTGFGWLDGKRVGESPESVKQDGKPLLTTGQRFQLTVEVRRDSLRALLDGKPLANWSGDWKLLSIGDSAEKLPDTQRLGLIAYGRAATFHTIQVREVTGSGTVVKTAAPAAEPKSKP